MSALGSLEKSLGDVYENAPELPANGKKTLVEWMPWISLVFGVLSLYAAWVLWHWAHIANGFVNLANQLSAAYGGPSVAVDRMSAMVWVSLVVMAAQGVLWLLAFPGLRARKKAGWDLLFYAAIMNAVYGVVVMFSDYGTAGNLIGALVESAIAFYFLFQIRGNYGKATAKA